MEGSYAVASHSCILKASCHVFLGPWHFSMRRGRSARRRGNVHADWRGAKLSQATRHVVSPIPVTCLSPAAALFPTQTAHHSATKPENHLSHFSKNRVI